jgi:hypothetical protein
VEHGLGHWGLFTPEQSNRDFHYLLALTSSAKPVEWEWIDL